jgi:hypothetical protein
MGELSVMGPLGHKALELVDGLKLKPGDTKIIWDPENEAEVESARRTFSDLVGARRFLAFRVAGEGRKGEQIREFDPDAEKLVITPPMAGG